MKKVYEKYAWDGINRWPIIKTQSKTSVNLQYYKQHNRDLKKAIKEQEEQTAKEIFADLDKKCNNSTIAPKFISEQDYLKIKKKYLGDVTFLKKKAHNFTFIESEEPKKVKK